MSDDLTEKIQQLKDMLNNNQLPDNLKNMMDLMSSASQDKEKPQSTALASNDGSNNEAMIKKIKKMMDSKKQINDPRLNLLSALKPYLGQKRQQRIDSCSKLLNFIQVSSLLNDDD